jgi:hypothetical protein
MLKSSFNLYSWWHVGAVVTKNTKYGTHYLRHVQYVITRIIMSRTKTDTNESRMWRFFYHHWYWLIRLLIIFGHPFRFWDSHSVIASGPCHYCDISRISVLEIPGFHIPISANRRAYAWFCEEKKNTHTTASHHRGRSNVMMMNIDDENHVTTHRSERFETLSYVW